MPAPSLYDVAQGVQGGVGGNDHHVVALLQGVCTGGTDRRTVLPHDAGHQQTLAQVQIF